MRNKNKKLYYILLVVSLITFIGSLVLLNNTKILAPTIIAISIYVFIGATIKLCNTNDKFRNTVIGALDLLFWMP
ncbi:MAG TPA: hypothetical protein PLT65_04090 [Bacilli bacterium]|jgi:uncharacterized membrane protein|nr:hypothetical protein [Bacilli bacterium]